MSLKSEATAQSSWLELGFGAAIGIYLLAVVVKTWNTPLVTTLLLALALFGQALFHKNPRDRIAMAIAAMLGTPAEIAEVAVGEWTYHAPNLIWGIPLWIPLIWANLFALFRRLTRTIHALLAQYWPKTGAAAWRYLFLFLALVIVAYWCSALLLMPKLPLVIGLYAAMMVIAGSFWHQEEDILIFGIGALLGAVGEYICIQLGYWHYANILFPQWGVDITLPLDWGLSAIIINRMANSIGQGHGPQTHGTT